MASYGRHEDQSRSTISLIAAGFCEFSRTSTAYLATVPLIHKFYAVGALIFSTILIGSFQKIKRKMEPNNSIERKSKDEGWFYKFKKSRVVKGSLSVVDSLLKFVENIVGPRNASHQKLSPKTNGRLLSGLHSAGGEVNGLPKLLNLRHISNSSNGTPANSHKPSESDWTPFSSVSAVDESVFDRSCVSLMEDLSQSTISTPIQDIRQQVASKIRAWRLVIQDLEGYPEFPTWSPVQTRVSEQQNIFTRFWNVFSWVLPKRFTGSDYVSVPGSGRKRKRLDGDDDDLALYIPHHKGVSKLNGRDTQMGSSRSRSPSPPSIRGLSVVPIIGNWFSAEKNPQSKSTEPKKTSEQQQLDHISLVQRDFLSPSKSPKDSTSESDPYEILEVEVKNDQEVECSEQT